MDERLRRRLVGGLVLLASLWLLAFLIPDPPAPGERREEQVVIDLRAPEAPVERFVAEPGESAEPTVRSVTPAPIPVDANTEAPTRAPATTPAPAPPATVSPTPAARPSVPRSAPTEAETAAGWWVQVGAYSGREAAEQVRETLRVADLPAVVQSARVEGRAVHRVRIGPYSAAAQAESAQARAVLLGHTQATVFRQ